MKIFYGCFSKGPFFKVQPSEKKTKIPAKRTQFSSLRKPLKNLKKLQNKNTVPICNKKTGICA